MAKRRKWSILFLGTVCFWGIIIHAIWIFQTESMQIYSNYKLIELKKTAELHTTDIQKDYAAKINALTILSKKAADLGETDAEKIYNDLQFLAELGFFDYVGISDSNGNAVDSAGKKINIYKRPYFTDVMNGKSASISNVLASRAIAGDNVQIIAVPILKNETAVGCIYGVHNIHAVNETLQNTTGSSIYTEIINANGTPVTLSETNEWLKEYESVWDFYEHCTFIEGSIEELKQNIDTLQSGYYVLQYNGQQRITYYTPLETEGYYIYSNLDMSLLDAALFKIKSLSFRLSAAFTAALILFCITTYIFVRQTFLQLRKAYKEAVSNEKTMQFAVQNSNIFLFEYDLKRKQLKRKAGEKHLLFPNPLTDDVPNIIVSRHMIDSEFIDIFLNAFEQIKCSESVVVTIQTTPEYHSLWFEFSMKNIYDKKHRIINTIGSIKNITDIKIQSCLLHESTLGQKLLKAKAERDSLTGLYNSAAAAERINKILNSAQNEREKHLLVFMDLDNFKSINDTFGHQYGNRVLIETAEIFTNKFRNDDIVARFGGDEFFAFLPHTKGFLEMEHVFSELVEECERTYTEDGVTVSTSVSLGIAAAPDHGTTFEQLSQKADKMLLAVKRDHKNGYKVHP